MSLPYAAQLIDGVKYMEPKDVPALEGSERRRQNTRSLRSLVRRARKCDSAEQLGERLRRRYQRQQARQGTGAGAERDRIFGEV